MCGHHTRISSPPIRASWRCCTVATLEGRSEMPAIAERPDVLQSRARNTAGQPVPIVKLWNGSLWRPACTLIPWSPTGAKSDTAAA
jgi:hypothetical protein